MDIPPEMRLQPTSSVPHEVLSRRRRDGKRILQSERNAESLVDVLRSTFAERKFKCIFLVMPITPSLIELR